MASSCCRSPFSSHKDALNELARGQLEILGRLQFLLLASPASGAGAQLPISFSDILEAQESMVPTGLASAAIGSGDGDQGLASSEGKADAGHHKRRKRSNCWTTTSCAPYDDGFQWRKYGEKKISKTKFTRSYLRCAYRDEQGCMATKQVQQKEMEDPPMFLVTYSNEHTCTCFSSLFLT